ncbi:SLATT domain-containing protein [Leucothrix arctica]|uniref:SMODS and SLOG-associating 2TM effector domain-containing protein n=1 Tax=Leucothrix arctica TaxID=1481894 RepID=A0A317CB22_9GAMM|nr:SLATT domain-containing protein [Leucothrix arctica]PWQ95559.1 hypothetical protein DKT75_12305 [Leucothrix arctica]
MGTHQSIENHLTHLRLRTHRKARAHYLASKSLSRKNIWFGACVILISAFVGSSVVTDLSKSVTYLTPQVFGILSLIAAILSSFQTFFGFSKLSEKHQGAASQYSSLYRSLSLLNTKYFSGEYENKTILTQLDEIQKTWNTVEHEAPDVPDSFYDKAKNEQLSDDEGV